MKPTETTETGVLLKVEQKPIIDYAGLEGVSALVDKRIKAFDIENQVATTETVKSLKSIRATLNKEFKEYEEQRKLIKEIVTKPLTDFENKYKELIAIKYKDADAKLKTKIYSVEDDLKNDRTDKLRTYFTELCLSKDIDFVTFKDANINVTLSASSQSLKDAVDTFVNDIERDLETIKVINNDDEFKAEVLAEYKETKDLNHSISVVQKRRDAKEAELAKKRAEAEKKEQEQQAKAEIKEEPKVAPPLQAPIAEKPQESKDNATVRASFEVEGTLAQLRSLKQFITDNNIKLL